jgi:hypothetical protein
MISTARWWYTVGGAEFVTVTDVPAAGVVTVFEYVQMLSPPSNPPDSTPSCDTSPAPGVLLAELCPMPSDHTHAAGTVVTSDTADADEKPATPSDGMSPDTCPNERRNTDFGTDPWLSATDTVIDPGDVHTFVNHTSTTAPGAPARNQPRCQDSPPVDVTVRASFVAPVPASPWQNATSSRMSPGV